MLDPCCFCLTHEESSIHIFKECSFAKLLWFGAPYPVQVEGFHYQTISEFIRWLLCDINIFDHRCFLVSACCILDHIWSTRNAVINIYNNTHIDPSKIRREVGCRFTEYLSLAPNTNSSTTTQVTPTIPHTLFSGACHPYTDASFMNNKAGVGVVAAMDDGTIVRFAFKHGMANNVLEAEFQAVFLAMKTALNNN